MSDLNYNGFYYIEGDTTNGYIDKSLSYDDNLANNQMSVKCTYQDILSKFETPVILSHTNGMYTCKFIMSENSEHTRTLIDPLGSVWRYIFSIANYVYNQFYVFSRKGFFEIDGMGVDEYIEKVLSQKVKDTKILSIEPFKPYIAESLKIHHVEPAVSSELYYKLRNFEFKVNWNSEIYTINMWVNPEYFVKFFKSLNPYVYIFYPSENQDLSEAIGDISKNISEKILSNFKQIQIPSIVEKMVGSSKKNVEIPVSFYIWSNEFIPAAPLSDSFLHKSIQDAIKKKESGLSASQLSKKYPSVFEEKERVIYPLIDNDAVNKLKFQNKESKYLVVSPISVKKLDKLISTHSELSGYKTFESSTILVQNSYIPFIVGGIGSGALTDKVPFFRPTVKQVEALDSFDEKLRESAKQFVKILSSVIDYQFNGANIEELRKDPILEFTETQTHCTVKYLGIIWKIINRKYDINHLIA